MSHFNEIEQKYSPQENFDISYLLKIVKRQAEVLERLSVLAKAKDQADSSGQQAFMLELDRLAAAADNVLALSKSIHS